MIKKPLINILISTAIFISIAFVVGGSSLVIDGLTSSKNTAIQTVPLLLVSFLLIGQTQVLITKEMLIKWLQKYNGVKGIIIGAFAGGLFPGGPYIYLPFIQSFTGKGMPFYILISFILGKNLYNLAHLSMEVSLIDPNIALLRYFITLPIPILVGLLAQRMYKNRTTESIFMKVGVGDGPDNRNSRNSS